MLAVVLVVMAAPRTALAADETLLLDVVVNGYPIGKIGEFVLRDGALFSRPSELIDLGFRIPDNAATTPDGLVALSSLPGLVAHLDQATQTLNVVAGTERLLPALLKIGAASGGGPVESGTGVTLDYDITGQSAAGLTSGAGLFDLRAFSPWGVLSSGELAYAGAGPSGPGGYSAIRLDSTYVYSDVASLRRYSLGDIISGGLSWTRPVRLGGAQIGSDFALRPDLVTFPLPAVSGSAAVPSTVDVLINGAQLLSRAVQPGPFQIPQLPVVTGAGTVALTVRDALGRQVTTTLPFYASSDLLAPDLQTYSIEVGAVRNNWGLVSNDYSNAAAAATYRRGLSPDLTVETHIEGTVGTVMGGVGVVANAFNLGVVSLAAAGSSSYGHTGTQFSAGAQRLGQVVSLGASVILADRNFRDIAAMNGDPVPRRQINASAGLSLGRWGSVGVAYTGVDRDSTPSTISFIAPFGSFIRPTTTVPGGVVSVNGNVVSFVPAEHAHVLSASYSVQVGNFSFYATGFRDFASGGGSGVLFGLTVPLGSRSSIGGSLGSSSGSSFAQVQASQSAITVGDWGYQLFAGAGDPNHEFAVAQYKSPWALVSAGADRIDHQTSFRAEAQGALSFLDGGLFASNVINDSFAVVDTNGMPGIRVYDENRVVGRTDSAGQLLLPDLRSYDLNRISIEPTDIAADATLPTAAKDVRPQDRSGIVVQFDIRTSHGALLRLVDAAGAPLPVGGAATLAGTGATVPIGYDGEAFVTDLVPHSNRLDVQLADGRRCVAVFDYRAAPGEIPTIGPLRCQEQR
jgi:outer membrane usher protein